MSHFIMRLSRGLGRLVNRMKSKHLIFVVCLTVLLVWGLSSTLNVQRIKSREGILLSPQESKSVEYINVLGSSQLLMNFHKNFLVGGSNIVSGDFEQNEIEYYWTDENKLTIEYPQDTRFNTKEEEIYFFGDTVKIQYQVSD